MLFPALVLSHMIARNRIVLSFKNSPRKPLGRRPTATGVTVNGEACTLRGPQFVPSLHDVTGHLRAISDKWTAADRVKLVGQFLDLNESSKKGERSGHLSIRSISFVEVA